VEEVEIKADIIINGGKCKYSMPSTVVDMSAWADEEKAIKIKEKIKRRGACYDRVLHILRSKIAAEGLHGFPVP